jgi:hypothetical protein
MKRVVTFTIAFCIPPLLLSRGGQHPARTFNSPNFFHTYP